MEDKFQLGIKALIKNSENKILLLKVNEKTLRAYTGEAYWDIPGGRIQKGSTVEETLRREVKEEIKISKIDNIKKLDMVISNIRIPVKNDNFGLILAIYTCSIPENSQIVLSDEHTEYAWFSPAEAAELLAFKYPKEFTDKILELE